MCVPARAQPAGNGGARPVRRAAGRRQPSSTAIGRRRRAPRWSGAGFSSLEGRRAPRGCASMGKSRENAEKPAGRGREEPCPPSGAVCVAVPLAVRLPGAGRSPACSAAAGSSGALPRTAARFPARLVLGGGSSRAVLRHLVPLAGGQPSSRFPALRWWRGFFWGHGWRASVVPLCGHPGCPLRQGDLRSGPALCQGLGRCEARGERPAAPGAGRRGRGGGGTSRRGV